MMTAVFSGSPASAAPDLSAATLTPVGNLTDASGGGLAAAFDGNFVRSYATAATSASGADGIIGMTYGVARVVYAVVAVAPTDAPFCGAGGSRAAYIQVSNDNSTWVTIWTGTYPTGNGATLMVRNLPNTPYLYIRVNMTGDGSSRMRVAQLSAY